MTHEKDMLHEVSLTWNRAPETNTQVLDLLKESPILYNQYRKLNPDWKVRFMDFCSGKKTLPLTYDPIFKLIFNPDLHPERLSGFVSSLLGRNVKVIGILSNADSMIDGGTLLIMDLLAETEDGSLINVEIQKQGYAFPAERISCYSADLLMRQYVRVKGEKGKTFTYRDIKKVYVIVIYEKSESLFHKIPEHYLHMGRITFDTGLPIELLQEYCLIALDVFREFPYPKSKNEQTAWLSLLTTETFSDAVNLIADYPWLREIYEEMAMLRQKPEEVLGMFSEALKILDQNTVTYMIEELQKDVKAKEAEIEAKDAEIEAKDAEIEALKKKLEEAIKR